MKRFSIIIASLLLALFINTTAHAENIDNWAGWKAIMEALNSGKGSIEQNAPTFIKDSVKNEAGADSDFITFDLDQTKITCNTPYVDWSIDGEFWTIDPGWGDDVCPQKEFFPSIYASIVKHHLNQKIKYETWWNKPCEVSTNDELIEAVKVSSGNKSIKGTFYSGTLIHKANCKDWGDWDIATVGDDCTGDDDSNDVEFYAYTDEWWHSHICATAVVSDKGERYELNDLPEGVTAEELFKSHSMRIVKKIVIKTNIALKNPIKVDKDAILEQFAVNSKGAYSDRIFDIEITGETNEKKEPITTIVGASFKKESPVITKGYRASNHLLTISNLNITLFSTPLVAYTKPEAMDNYPVNIKIVHNAFANNFVTMIYPYQATEISDNTVINVLGIPFIDLSVCDLDGESCTDPDSIDKMAGSGVVSNNKIISNYFSGTPPFIKTKGRFFDKNIIYMNSFVAISPSDTASINIEYPEEITFTESEKDTNAPKIDKTTGKTVPKDPNKGEGCAGVTSYDGIQMYQDGTTAMIPSAQPSYCTKLIFKRNKRTPVDPALVTLAELYYHGSKVGLACSFAGEYMAEAYKYRKYGENYLWTSKCTAHLREIDRTDTKSTVVIWLPYQSTTGCIRLESGEEICGNAMEPKIDEAIFHDFGEPIIDEDLSSEEEDKLVYTKTDIGSVIADVTFSLEPPEVDRNDECVEICTESYMHCDEPHTGCATNAPNCDPDCAPDKYDTCMQKCTFDPCSDAAFDKLQTDSEDKCSAVCGNDALCMSECKDYWACASFQNNGCNMASSCSDFDPIPTYGPYDSCNYFEKRNGHNIDCETEYPNFPQKREECKTKKACEDLKAAGCDEKIPEDYKNNCYWVLPKSEEDTALQNECSERKFKDLMGSYPKICSLMNVSAEKCGKANACSILKGKDCDVLSPTLWKQYCGTFNANDPLIFQKNRQNYVQPDCPNNDYTYVFSPQTGEGSCKFKGCFDNTIKITEGSVERCEECPEGYNTSDNLKCNFVACPEEKIEVTLNGKKVCEEKKSCGGRFKLDSGTNDCICKDSSMIGSDCKCPDDKPDFKNGICQEKKITKPVQKECTTDADCKDGKICSNNVCVELPADKCADEGQEYDGMLDKCVCAEGYICADKKDNNDCICEAEKPVCSGYTDPMSGICIVDPDESACLQKGWKWDAADKACTDPDVTKTRAGGGCSISQQNSPSDMLMNILPYLALLILLKSGLIRRKVV